MELRKTDISAWSDNIEKILKKQYDKCAAYKWMHDYECDNISSRNTVLNFLNILLVSVSATTSLITNNYTMHNTVSTVINIMYPIFLYISTVISSLQHFLNYEKEAEKHRTASIRYNALYNNIIRMLALPPSERQEVNNYFNWATKEYDNVFSSSPDISDKAKDQFKKQFSLNIEEEITISDLKEVITVKNTQHLSESEKIKYELERFMVNSYNC